MKLAQLILAFFLILAVPICAQPPRADPSEADVRRHLDSLRNIAPTTDAAYLKSLNERMDSTWSFVKEHRGVALPVVESELHSALKKSPVDSFFIMDLAYLLMTERGEEAADLGVMILEKLSGEEEIIRWNWRELVEFAKQVGSSGKETARYLRAADRIFLASSQRIDAFNSGHVIKLDALDIASMIFGVTGDAGADYLAAQLEPRPADRVKILKLLTVLSSERQSPLIATLLSQANDAETVGNCVTALMYLGGPSGRDAVLAASEQDKHPKAREYLVEIAPKVRATNLSKFVEELTKQGYAGATLTDAEIQRLLDGAELNSHSPGIPAITVLNSTLPTEPLLHQMKRIRARAFRPTNNHVFEHVFAVNRLINALQFKLGDASNIEPIPAR